MWGMSFKTIGKIALVTIGSMYAVNQLMAMPQLSALRPYVKANYVDTVTSV